MKSPGQPAAAATQQGMSLCGRCSCFGARHAQQEAKVLIEVPPGHRHFLLNAVIGLDLPSAVLDGTAWGEIVVQLRQ